MCDCATFLDVFPTRWLLKASILRILSLLPWIRSGIYRLSRRLLVSGVGCTSTGCSLKCQLPSMTLSSLQSPCHDRQLASRPWLFSGFDLVAWHNGWLRIAGRVFHLCFYLHLSLLPPSLRVNRGIWMLKFVLVRLCVIRHLSVPLRPRRRSKTVQISS